MSINVPNFNVPNFGTIGPGNAGSGPLSMFVGYIFGSGDDHGAQFAEGNPEDPGAFLVSDQEEILRSDSGVISYGFRLTNSGNATSLTLAGGGLS